MSSSTKFWGNARALTEVVAVAGGYVGLSMVFVRWADFSAIFSRFEPTVQATGADFLEGALIQLLLVGGLAVALPEMRRSISASFVPAPLAGWTIAGIATAIHVGTGVLVVIPSAHRVWEPSITNLVLSAIPAVDGWTQELVFRGYVLARLARGGVPTVPQALISGALFSAIHIGYMGDGFRGAAMPILGTFLLGAFFAWAVQRAHGSLKPVVAGHVLIIVTLQPWLALAY